MAYGKSAKKWTRRFLPKTSYVAKKAYKGVKYLKGIINSELKHNDTTRINAGVDYNGFVEHVTNINQGTAQDERNGNSILMKSLFNRGDIKANITTNENTVRVMLIRDTMNTGTAPSASDVLKYTASSVAPFSPINDNTAGRYKILKSNLYCLNTNGTRVRMYKDYRKMQKHCKYIGVNGTDEFKNQLYMIYISDAAPGAANVLPHVNMISRVAYYDN